MKPNLKINNFLKNNSSTILTAIGSIGVGVTAVISARDTIKAMKRIDEQKPIDTKEKIKIAAPCYIPTAICGLSTILCICGANKLNKNVQKSLTSAYVLLDQSYKEYKKSVEEVYGEDGHTNVVKNIADRKAEESNIVKTEDTDIFFDYFGLQFFESNVSKIREAEKSANEILNTKGYVSLSTVYSLLGIDVVGTDSLLGWSYGAGKAYGYDHVEIEITPMEREDGKIQYILDFVSHPTEDYLHLI